ncbi:hypothetical protein ACFOLF_36910 [Paenibacillus sepulcri]|uniref:Uncharacterized protein n=1 Tax=Paenibacillus sepulcri TaxID=359917 RepID=A0ABS7BXG0_9BACL|nr:hypothetical protein [Paenibacillus sepulcri]
MRLLILVVGIVLLTLLWSNLDRSDIKKPFAQRAGYFHKREEIHSAIYKKLKQYENGKINKKLSED